MSADALADIQKILRKHKISAKLTTWYEEGTTVTKIVLKDLTGFQSSKPPRCAPVCLSKPRKRKSPSRLRRDSRRSFAYTTKMTGACAKDPGPTVRDPDPPIPHPISDLANQDKPMRRFATPSRKLRTGSVGTVEGDVGGGRRERWRPDVTIPQLDGAEGREDGNRTEDAVEEEVVNFQIPLKRQCPRRLRNSPPAHSGGRKKKDARNNGKDDGKAGEI